MLDNALNLLKLIEEKGYKAYIVGGYPRDIYLKRKSLDIDICTSATPKDLKDIFKDSQLSNMKYGSVTLYYHKIRFEITTFRKEIKYENHRLPVKIKYIDNLLDDLKRRDFTINTMCLDSSGEMIDLLNAKQDLDNHLIKVVGSPEKKLKEDALRILRAIRFATTLNFEIEDSLKTYIKKYSYLVKDLSSYRKKEELDKIFVSPNIQYGIKLLTDLKLLEPLEIPNLAEIVITDSIIGIWAQLEAKNYIFTSHESKMIKEIKELTSLDVLDSNVLYKYGLYVCELAGLIKGINHSAVANEYNKLSIHSKSDIKITTPEINTIYHQESGPYLKALYDDLEDALINKMIINDNQVIKDYLIEKKTI